MLPALCQASQVMPKFADGVKMALANFDTVPHATLSFLHSP